MIYLFRTLNLLEIIIKYFFSVILKKVWISKYPFAVSIEPTNFCQLQCAECPTGKKTLTRSKGYMEIDLYEKIIKNIYKRTFYINLYFQGEPLLHPNLYEMIEIARKHKMYVVLSTNGQLLNEQVVNKIILSGLNEIIISLDGFSDETYTKYRKNGNLQKVKTGIELLVKAKHLNNKSKPKIIVQTLVNRYNEHEISKIKEWVKKLGNVTLKLKSMQIYERFDFIPSNNKFSRYRYKNGGWILKHRLKNSCFRIWTQCVITHDGNVVPCCFDKNAEFVMGNIKYNNLNDIWNNKNFYIFRNKILSKRIDIHMCNNCTE